MTLFLSEARWLRLSVFTAFYFAQGVPIGLMQIAMAAYLAQADVAASDIATFIGVISFPWAIKLVAGPFMDRFRFPEMGKRRPWVLLAQGGLTLSMLSLTVISDPVEQLDLLMVLGFIISAFSATQDVAVDGMAIDILPMDERGRANALMAFGQVVSYSSFSALCGFLLVNYGLAVTAVLATVVVAVIFLIAAMVRERPGERLLPWGEGEAASAEAKERVSFMSVWVDLVKVLFLPMSIILTLVEFSMRMGAGFFISVMPVFAVQELGYSADQYSAWYGYITAIAALLGIFVGPLIDRTGAVRWLYLGLGVGAGVAFIFALTPQLWGDTSYVLFMLFVYSLASQIVFITTIALYMNICWPRVSATQFAIYMSLANLARSFGAFVLAFFVDYTSYATEIMMIGGLLALSAILLPLFSLKRHQERLDDLSAAYAT